MARRNGAAVEAAMRRASRASGGRAAGARAAGARAGGARFRWPADLRNQTQVGPIHHQVHG